jgi:glycerophosphoryl diester phosphodiesterase
MSSAWTSRRVIGFAHQGGAKEAPASTLFAIRRAIELGATAIELDVHATADRHLVVCHDATLDRTTNGRGAIAEKTLEEIGALDNAYYFLPGLDCVPDRPSSDYPLRGRAPADPTLTVATLEEVLEEFPGVVLNLDIKQTAPRVEPYEALLASMLRDHGRGDDVIVASFLDTATDAFSKIAPEIATSAGSIAVAEFYRAMIEGSEIPTSVTRHVALQVPATHGDITVVDQRFVDTAHAVGLAVHVWTIDDPVEMARLVGLGVDGIISDRPSVLLPLLSELGVAWEGLGDRGGAASDQAR